VKKALIIILTVCAVAIAQDLPRIAVYVTGDVPNNEKEALGTRMLASLVNSGRYTAIERSNSFLAEIDKEQARQRSGAIDDRQISELGRQFGVNFVCIAAINPAFGDFQVSARIVDVETAVVVFIGESASSLKSMTDLARVSDQVVKNMFGLQTTSARKPAFDPPPKHAANPVSKNTLSFAEQQTQYENFTRGERFGTFGLNLLPGVGSIVIMQDWWGAAAQWVLFGSGIALTFNGIDMYDTTYYSGIYMMTETRIKLNGLFWPGIALLTGNAVYNGFRSATYRKKAAKNTASLENAGFNIAVLPDKDGNIRGCVVYSMEF